MDIEKITDIDQLSGEQRELAETIGLDAYKKLVKYCGGSRVYIKKPDTLTKNARNSEIKQKFDGGNIKKLAIEYNLSESAIRNILFKK